MAVIDFSFPKKRTLQTPRITISGDIYKPIVVIDGIPACDSIIVYRNNNLNTPTDMLDMTNITSTLQFENGRSLTQRQLVSYIPVDDYNFGNVTLYTYVEGKSTLTNQSNFISSILRSDNSIIFDTGFETIPENERNWLGKSYSLYIDNDMIYEKSLYYNGNYISSLPSGNFLVNLGLAIPVKIDITRGGVFQFKAISTRPGSGFLDSDLTEPIEIFVKLRTPVLNVEYNELTNKAIISWNEIEGAKKYIVKRNGSIVTSTDLLNYETNIIGNYEVIATNDDNEYLLDSEPAEIIVSKHWELNAPIISLDGNIIKWFSIENAVKYIVTKNGDDYTETLANMFIVPDYGTYKVIAVADDLSLFYNSDASNSVSYDRLTITLYNNSSEPNRLDKNYFLNNALELRGSLRHTTSITNPIIEVAMFNPPTYNYAYIPSFGRYYYITDVQSIRTGLWELTLAVDALMSFKDKVLDTWALVSRNENDYDLFINDPLIPVTTQPNVETKRLATGIFSTSTVDGVKARCFVMTFAGYTDSDNRVVNGPYLGSSVNATYFLNIDELREVFSKIYNTDFWSNVGNLFGGDPTEGIISIKEYPLNFDDLLEDGDYQDVTEIEVPFGKNLSEIHARKLIKNRLFRVIVEDLNTGTVRGMEDLPPFCSYQMYIPFYGFIDLPPSFIGNDFRIYWNISLRDGSVFIELQRSGEQVECVLEGSIGMDIPISRSGATERLSAYANTAMKIVGGAVSGGTSLAVGGIQAKNLAQAGADYTLGAIQAQTAQVGRYITTGIDTFNAGLSSAISVKHTFPSVNIGQTYSSFFLENIITLIISRPTTVLVNRTNSRYRHLLGLPNNSFYELKDVHGYTICNTFHLDGFDNAFDSELQDIAVALKTGIILPD